MLGKITEVSEGQAENLAFLASQKMFNRKRIKALLLTSHKKHLFLERNGGCHHTGSCTVGTVQKLNVLVWQQCWLGTAIVCLQTERHQQCSRHREENTGCRVPSQQQTWHTVAQHCPACLHKPAAVTKWSCQKCSIFPREIVIPEIIPTDP